MTVDEIVALAEDCMAGNITSFAWESVFGIESQVEGREDFLKEFRERLQEKMG